MRRFLSIVLICTLLATYASSEEVVGLPTFAYYNTEVTLNVEDDKPYVENTTRFAINYPTDLAVRSLPYFSIHMSSDMELIDLDVYTLFNGKKYPLRKDEIKKSVGMDEDYFVNDNTEIKLPFRALRKGATVFVEYTIASDELRYFRPLYFKLFLAANAISHKLSYPEDMDIHLVKKNLKGVEFYEEVKNKRGVITREYFAEDTEPVEYFEDGPAIAHYSPHIIPVLSSYQAGGSKKVHLKSPMDLYKWYISQVYKNGDGTIPELEEIAQEIKSQGSDRASLLRNTYEWVKSHIRYVAYEAGDDGIIPRAASKVCERKFGDCKDMSNLMKKLLQINGIDASLAWIGTRRIPYTYEELFTMNTDNHMILAVRDPAQKWILLDATDPSGKYGLPTPAIQGKQAMIAISDAEYELFNVPIISSKQNTAEYDVDLVIDNTSLNIQADLIAEGITGGRLSSLMLYTNENEKNKVMLALIEVNENQAELKSSKVNKSEDKIEVKNEYKLDGRIKKVANYYFINPYVSNIIPFGAIDIEDRTVPRDIELNRTLRNNVKLHIPEQYALVSKPEGLSFSGDNFSYTLEYKEEGKKLSIHEELILDSPKLQLSVADSKKWNELLTKLKTIYSTPLKLSKI